MEPKFSFKYLSSIVKIQYIINLCGKLKHQISKCSVSWPMHVYIQANVIEVIRTVKCGLVGKIFHL